ncbi:MAG: hypothetical protein R6U63_11145 [Longimicrobiales bacterium]
MHGLVRSVVILALAAPTTLGGQSAVVAVAEENFRAAPGGVILAELLEGTPLRLGDAEGRWREATLEAWIWAPSVQPDDRGGHDLAVSAADGENLRATPNGQRIGRARTGMLLDRLEEQGRWIRVERTGWIWGPSIRAEEAVGPAAPPEPGAGEPTREFSTAGDDAILRAAPGGDTVARLQPGADVEVLNRDGDWVRIRVEGWTFAASLGADSAAPGVLREVTREEIQAEPDRYRGRLVEWTVQFIALREAEQFRTDFLPGEQFILARGPNDDAGFVYLAVPAELLTEVRSLTPLQRIRALGRIRSAESPLTAAPVLDLLEITGR